MAIENFIELAASADGALTPGTRSINYTNHRTLEKKIINSSINVKEKSAAAIKAVATVALDVGVMVAYRDSSDGTLKIYELIAGDGTSNDDENLPLVIQPTDYNASTNVKIWAQCIDDVSVNLQKEFEFDSSLFTVTERQFKGKITAVELQYDSTNDASAIDMSYRKATDAGWTDITPDDVTGINGIMGSINDTDIWYLRISTTAVATIYSVSLKYNQL